MKLRPSHESALAAAARVSCCATLLVGSACRPAIGTEDISDDADPTAPAGQDVVAEPDPYVDDPELDPSNREAPKSSERAAFEQCQADVVAAVEADKLGEEHAACCETVGSYQFAGNDPNLDEATAMVQAQHDREIWGQVDTECCALIGQAAMACTPWGPPMPPSHRATRGRSVSRLDLRRPARRARPVGVSGRGLDPELRSRAIATWSARMVNEHGSAPVFEGLVTQLEGLVALGVLADADLDKVRGFAAQERRHGILCGAVVEALGGEAEAEALPTSEFPTHAEVSDPIEACLRNILSICCLSETVAVALIAAEREDMPASPLRELLTGIWAEECGHANWGWRLLATLLPKTDAASRERLTEYLALAFAELERHELAHLPVAATIPPGGEAYGLCDGHEARALFYATVERVIVPGLAARGLGAEAAWQARAA